MIIRVLINTQNIGAHYKDFETMEEAQQWADFQKFSSSWGMPTRIEIEYNELGEEISRKEIPADFTVEILDVTESLLSEKSKQEKIQAGKKARETCQAVLDLIAGFNLDRELTIGQISQMQTTFSQAELALRSGRPSLAKGAISAISPDGELITVEMKNQALQILESY